MATIKGSPWQYPTSGSYLSRNLVSNDSEAGTDSQGVSFQYIEQIFLPNAMPIREERVVRECPIACYEYLGNGKGQ